MAKTNILRLKSDRFHRQRHFDHFLGSNQENLTKRCLESYLKNSQLKNQLYNIDNASSDGTYVYLKALVEGKSWAAPKNLNRSSSYLRKNL